MLRGEIPNQMAVCVVMVAVLTVAGVSLAAVPGPIGK